MSCRSDFFKSQTNAGPCFVPLSHQLNHFLEAPKKDRVSDTLWTFRELIPFLGTAQDRQREPLTSGNVP